MRAFFSQHRQDPAQHQHGDQNGRPDDQRRAGAAAGQLGPDSQRRAESFSDNTPTRIERRRPAQSRRFDAYLQANPQVMREQMLRDTRAGYQQRRPTQR